MKTLTLVIAVLLLAAPAAADFGLWCDDADVVRVEVDGADVTVIHEAAVYNCCPDPFEFETAWDGDRLVVTEHEVLTNPCFCVCCFDLSFTVENVPPGDWVLRFAWWDTESTGWTEVELPFTVADMGQGGPAAAGASDDSGCLASSSIEAVPETLTWSTLKTIYH